MSGVLHPVGPEPASTYWLRRALVLAVLVVLVSVVVGLATRGNDPVTAVPAAPASSSSSPLVAPGPAATPTAGPRPSSPSSTSSSSTVKRPSPRSSATSSPSRAAATETAKPKKAKTTTKPPASSWELCDPASLRPTLTGERVLRPKQKTTFNLSLINGSNHTCSVSVDAENFELRIVSGKDTVWTSGDCATAVPSLTKTVASQKAVVWQMGWNGRRSGADCTNRPQVPKAGTYVATAQLEGASPVKLRLTLR